jgi:sugar lactone lactonase YvrE
LRLLSIIISGFVLLFFASLAMGEGTRTWEQSRFDDLTKGTAKGVAIRSAGGLELAPAFKSIATTPSTYIWSIASDQAGSLYAATGSPARVYRITPDGQSTPIFEPQELQVQALVVDSTGIIYAATNPDGKVYRIEHLPVPAPSPAEAGKDAGRKAKSTSEFSASVYFDPKTKYIWDLALDGANNLYIATGDHGEIFRVTPREHSVFFKSDEAHIRVLAFDPRGNLIAGSDGSGLVYRISPSGEGFVLFSAPKKEITALAIDRAGNIFAAGAGERRTAPTQQSFPSTSPSSPPPATSTQPQGGLVISSVTPSNPSMTGPLPTQGASSSGGSEIYRVAPDGSPSRMWTSSNDLVYALAFDQRGRLLAGTGNRGHIFAISGEDEFTDLLKASATQVTAFAKAPNGGLYASTSNLGKVFLLGASTEPLGSYESDVFDARIFSRWGRAEFRGVGNVELFARSGNVDNPDRNWSPWKKIDLLKDAEVSVPPARFIQWKAVLRAGEPAPRVDSIALNYLPKNVAPDFDEVTVQTGTRYQSLPKPVGTDTSMIVGGIQQPRFDSFPPPIRDRDSIGVRWAVHDDNDDQMVYSVYYRGDGESRWLLLKDNLTDKFYSFDASLLPDGGYTFKVVASDAPSHSPEQALSTEKESTRIEVDTTPPQIDNLAAVVEGGQIHVTFRSHDSFSSIKRAEYSVDAGDWQFIEPLGQLSDSKVENYDFRASLSPKSPADSSVAAGGTDGRGAANGQMEHVVVVRVYDRYDNMISAKTVIRGGATTNRLAVQR